MANRLHTLAKELWDNDPKLEPFDHTQAFAEADREGLVDPQQFFEWARDYELAPPQ
jgi:hypothetical protein